MSRVTNYFCDICSVQVFKLHQRTLFDETWDLCRYCADAMDAEVECLSEIYKRGISRAQENFKKKLVQKTKRRIKKGK